MECKLAIGRGLAGLETGLLFHYDRVIIQELLKALVDVQR